ncbi:MAG TPA: hypothetical protein VMG55_17795 [Stellaceae bacterium]|nr:hypothetical protein [Stellaceae bacterium]
MALIEAISVNPVVIGSASGLYGFFQMAIGAVCTTLAGLGSPLPPCSPVRGSSRRLAFGARFAAAARDSKLSLLRRRERLGSSADEKQAGGQS